MNRQSWNFSSTYFLFKTPIFGPIIKLDAPYTMLVPDTSTD